MGDRAKNMGKMMNNPKQRNMYFLIIGLAVVTLGVGFYFVSQDQVATELPAGANVAAVPVVNAVPGTSTSPEYNNQVAQANEEAAKRALAGNQTFIPTPVNRDGISSISPIDQIDREREEARRLKAEQDAKEIAELEAIQEQERAATPPPVAVVQPAPVVLTPPPAPQVKKPKYGPEDYAIVSVLMQNTVAKAPSSEFNFVGQSNSQNTGVSNVDQNQSYTQGDMNGAVQAQNTTNNVEAPLAKAGTIFNAILETAVNSDEPSPILAKIVSGPLAGTRIIGSTQLVGEKMVLQFSTANIPAQTTSTSISAVAIDPATSRTALASDVNNHYFKRYGILLGSAFLTGWAQAIRDNNSISTITPIGGVVTVPKDGLSTSDINKQALGTVGTEIGNSVRQSAQQIKPTVKIDSGIAIGILLMSDLTLKK